MQRPLKKRVSAELNWGVSIQEIPHTANTSYPIFEWIFGGDVVGGRIRAWPFSGIFIFEVREETKKFGSLEMLLTRIDAYGWGEPPHIDEVFQHIVEATARRPLKDLEEFKEFCDELRQKWQVLVSSATLQVR